ncbi:MAG: cobalt-precorrin 5A hydrolase, partial [Cetobacterium sp.]
RAVSEPCAYLSSSKDGKFIEMKAKKDGMTISIYEERFIYEKR